MFSLPSHRLVCLNLFLGGVLFLVGTGMAPTAMGGPLGAANCFSRLRGDSARGAGVLAGG